MCDMFSKAGQNQRKDYNIFQVGLKLILMLPEF